MIRPWHAKTIDSQSIIEVKKHVAHFALKWVTFPDGIFSDFASRIAYIRTRLELIGKAAPTLSSLETQGQFFLSSSSKI